MNKKDLLKLWAIVMVAMLSVGFASCSSDDDDDSQIDTSPITLYAGDKTMVQGATSVESENKFVVWVNEDKSVEGFHVGETFIKVNGKSRIPVTVKGKYNTYEAPVTEWGCNQAFVKSQQKQGTLSSKSDATSLIYDNVGRAERMLYSFENGKLKSVGTVVSTAYTSEFAGYMSERFFMLPYEKDNDTYFIGIDALEVEKAKTYAMLQVYNYKYLVAIYMSASEASRSSKTKVNLPEKIKELLK